VHDSHGAVGHLWEQQSDEVQQRPLLPRGPRWGLVGGSTKDRSNLNMRINALGGEFEGYTAHQYPKVQGRPQTSTDSGLTRLPPQFLDENAPRTAADATAVHCLVATHAAGRANLRSGDRRSKCLRFQTEPSLKGCDLSGVP